MPRKPLTISIDPEVLKKFKKYCKKRDISMSRRIERYMKMELDSEKDRANVNFNIDFHQKKHNLDSE